MRRLVIVVLVLFALAPFVARAASDGDLVAAGRAALDKGDLDGAIAQLEKAVAAKPDSAEAHYWLANACGRKAQKAGGFSAMSFGKKAKAGWLRAVELNPDYIDARFRLLEFYVAAPGIAGGSEAKAKEQAAEIKKRDALEGHRAYARIYTMQKNYDLAVKEMREAVREQPNSAKTHYYLANTLMNQKVFLEALQEYEKALSLDAGYMPIHLRIGQHAAMSESNYVRGEESVRKYLAYTPADDEPGHGSAWYWLGVIQEKQGQKAAARESYTKAQKLAPESKDVGEALKRVGG
jgi:tetratricopeptide (TPR) repeat protein